MEEARQYSALTSDQRVFETVYMTGSIILVTSIIAQMVWRIDALYPAILGVGGTRICLAGWQLFDPHCSKILRTKLSLSFLIVAWITAIAVLIWMHGR